MIPVSIQINVAAVQTEIEKIEELIQKGTENGVRAAGKLAAGIAKPKIPVRTGETAKRLRVTFSHRKGDFVGRIGVRNPRRHIMRFLENGTESHGRHGGPLPARHIMADTRAAIEPRVQALIDEAIQAEIDKSKL